MAKKNRSKLEKKRKRHTSISFSERLFKEWNERNLILKFVLGFGVLMAIFYSFWSSDIFINNVLNPVVNASALLAGSILNIFGYNVNISGPKVFSPEFSISINKGCDALEPIAIYLFAVLLFPASLRYKIPGIAIGIPFLFVINQVRIISLFLIGVHAPEVFGDSFILFFDIMHIQVWQVIFILITLMFLAYWTLWAIKKEALTKESTAHVTD